MTIDSAIEQDIEDDDSGKRIVESIENNEFLLLYQLIDPFDINSSDGRHYEVFIRLMAEEEFAIPPGIFFPLAEKHGLMPSLDRWVVENVLKNTSNLHLQGVLDDGSMFFVNLAGATIRDQSFPEFVKEAMKKTGATGAALCFEIPGEELNNSVADVAKFSKAIREMGCHVAISGFDRDKVSFDLIRDFQVDFLKIDGNIIFNIHRESFDLAIVSAIHKVAKKLGVKTVAEFVENEETISKLKEVGINFGQGFGIAKPQAFESDKTEIAE
jgi:EAL domain-containing protein (putative c-di-GMP-specific phosphodiesterase class I)